MWLGKSNGLRHFAEGYVRRTSAAQKPTMNSLSLGGTGVYGKFKEYPEENTLQLFDNPGNPKNPAIQVFHLFAVTYNTVIPTA